MYANIVDDIERASSNNNIREVYQKENILIDKTSRRALQIRDSKGEIIIDEIARLQRWAEYFEDLLNVDEPDELHDFSQFPASEELDINMEPLTREELDKTINLLKRNKAQGIDSISPKAA